MTHWTEHLFQEQGGTFVRFFDRNRRFDAAAEEVHQLLQLVEDERGVTPDRTLDVACGSGRHVLAFADEGCHAEGMDFSAESIDRAQERATEKGLDDRVEFHVHDMRELDEWNGSFDLITNFWNSMGYHDKATDVEILTEMNRLLSEEGVVAIEMNNKECAIKNFVSSKVREGDDHLYVERRDFDPATGRFPTRIDVFSIADSRYEHVETMEFEPRLYAPVEWVEMCETAGFDNVSLFGGFGGEPLSLDSKLVVVLAS
jgi:ubiquinone/menaquinone biosynthesis C-methylase UbiE